MSGLFDAVDKSVLPSTRFPLRSPSHLIIGRLMTGRPSKCGDLATAAEAAATECSPLRRYGDRDLLMAGAGSQAGSRLAGHTMEMQTRRTLAPLPSIISKDPSK